MAMLANNLVGRILVPKSTAFKRKMLSIMEDSVVNGAASLGLPDGCAAF